MANVRKRHLATVVVDIDGVIASKGFEVRSNLLVCAYEMCEPISEGISMLRELRARGAVIILHTARWEGARDQTVKWLDRHRVPYDGLFMGKPLGDLYIDDKGYRFKEGVLNQMERILKLISEMPTKV